MDRQWSQNLVIAWVLWGVGATIIALDLFSPEDDIGHVGLALVILGAVFHNRELACKLKQREQAAFELGRDVGRDFRSV